MPRFRPKIALKDAEIAVEEAVEKAQIERFLPAICRPRVPRVNLDDPATIGFPPTLPLELALGEVPRNEILTEYGLDADSWDVLRANPVFQRALRDAVDTLAKDGMAFRVKARMQSEALLETSWKLIHSQDTPSAVKADLIKHTHRVAGLEPKDGVVVGGTNLQINLHLG